MKILVINCGSSSIKYKVFTLASEDVLAKGIVERIGMMGSQLTHVLLTGRNVEKKTIIEKDINDHQAALGLIVGTLLDQEYGVLTSLGDIKAVGHRVVHGGEKFSEAVMVDDHVIKSLRACSDMAPLHNPPNLLGISATQEYFPWARQIAVFDTAFHQKMPQKAYLYGLPYRIYQEYGVRRYGFHGTSHQYVAERAAVLLGQALGDLKIITCHLGNGASIAAVKNGIAVDTSMGFTPLEGLVMGTRSGNVDPAIIPYLMEKEGLSVEEVNTLLNKESGVLGLSGLSSDFRDLIIAEKQGNTRAAMALDVFAYNVVKYIGAYFMIMGGTDALVFTAGVGENSPEMRNQICSYLKFIGVEIDQVKNSVNGKETIISNSRSSYKVLIIPANEELMIAREVKKLL
ncbi:MAG: acetate kinase [Firmicutes bacterium]|nr:acetate kinase [Bacillota bacterium]